MDGRTIRYLWIRDQLRERIQEGVWTPGERIPPEPQLCHEFAVSRITIRHALAELTSLGFLTRVQGKGTFVRDPRREMHLINISTMYTRLGQENPLKPSEAPHQLLKASSGAFSPLGSHLSSKDPTWFIIERVRLVGTERTVYEQGFLLLDVLSRIPTRHEQESHFFIEILEECSNAKIATVRLELQATRLGKIAAEALKIAAEICIYTNDQLTIEELDIAV